MIKIKPLTLVLLMLTLNLVYGQKRIFIDTNGDTLARSEIKLKKNELGKSITSWSYIGNDNKVYVKLSENIYLKGIFDYQMIKVEIENITNSKLNDSTTILIKYFHKDDLCTEERKDNTWSKIEIKNRKSFLRPIKKEISDKGIYFICLFEKGIDLKNKKNSEKEYFFSDENSFFKDNIFLESFTCGSYAAIKPNGETLIRNGEYRADWFSNHLEDENWSIFFKEDEND